jgi:hypothetical protein
MRTWQVALVILAVALVAGGAGGFVYSRIAANQYVKAPPATTTADRTKTEPEPFVMTGVGKEYPPIKSDEITILTGSTVSWECTSSVPPRPFVAFIRWSDGAAFSIATGWEKTTHGTAIIHHDTARATIWVLADNIGTWTITITPP